MIGKHSLKENKMIKKYRLMPVKNKVEENPEVIEVEVDKFP